MNLASNDRGYAVMNASLTSYRIDGYSIEKLIPYCTTGYVIAERIPKVVGFSLNFDWFEYSKPFVLKGYYKNILWLHWSISKRYLHFTGKIVYTGV